MSPRVVNKISFIHSSVKYFQSKPFMCQALFASLKAQDNLPLGMFFPPLKMKHTNQGP